MNNYKSQKINLIVIHSVTLKKLPLGMFFALKKLPFALKKLPLAISSPIFP